MLPKTRESAFVDIDGRPEYACTFSPTMRSLAAVPLFKKRLQALVEGGLAALRDKPEVVRSLSETELLPNTSIARQMDIRFKEDGPVTMKLFFEWRRKEQLWLVSAELGDENYFEQYHINEGALN